MNLDKPEFDTSVNAAFTSNVFDTQSTFIGDIVGGATATVVDIGASLWNSLPFTTEVDTGDILGRISGDALRVYQEHPDTIKTLSLIGGSLAPGLAAVKGMNALRSGSRSVNWFTKAGAAEDMASVNRLVSEAKQGTAEFKSLTRGIFTKKAVNEAIDAVAAEAAIVMMMNSHPMMEDYLEDPVKNFAIGAAFGGAIGGTIGIIADNFALKKVIGLAEEKAWEPLHDAIAPLYSGLANASSLQVMDSSVHSLDNIIGSLKGAGKTRESDLTMSYASQSRDIIAADQIKVFNAMFPSVEGLEKPVQEAMMRTFLDNSFAGVEKASFTKPGAAIVSVTEVGKELGEVPILSKIVKKIVGGEEVTTERSIRSVYYPDTKLHGPEDTVKHYAGLAILGKTEEQLIKGIGKSDHRVPNIDWSLTAERKSTALVEADFAAWQLKLSQMDDAAFKKFVSEASISSTDIPLIQALVNKLETSPTLRNEVKVKIAEYDVARIGKLEIPGKEAVLGDLKEFLDVGKFDMVESMLRKGVPLPVIAKRANIPQESLTQYIAGERSFEQYLHIDKYGSETGTGMTAFRSSKDVMEANSILNRPITLAGNPRKVNYATKIASMDNMLLGQMNEELTLTALRASDSSVANQLADYYSTNKHMFDVVKSQLAKGNNGYAGVRMWNSADFFMRHMGDIGPVFAQTGKFMQTLANGASKAIITPMAQAAEAVTKDALATAEFAIFKNINDGLSDYRIYKDRQLWQYADAVGADGKPTKILEAVRDANGAAIRIQSDTVDALIKTMQEASPELLKMANVSRRIKGQANVHDIGLYIPTINPIDKFISYVHYTDTGEVRFLYGNTKEEMESAIKAFSEKHLADNIKIYRKGVEQEQWSIMNGRFDPIHMKRADIGEAKKGTAATADIPNISRSTLSEAINGYEHYINAQVRNMADLMFSDITDTLRMMSKINTRNTEGQTLSAVKRAISGDKDAALSLNNTLLGIQGLGEYEGWKSINQSFETQLSFVSNSVGTLWKDFIKPFSSKTLKGEHTVDYQKITEADFKVFMDEATKRGMPLVTSAFDKATARQFGVANIEDVPDISKKMVYTGNALAATIALRVGELAQPLVNMVSLPIMSYMAMASKMPDTFLGVQKGTAKVMPSQIMYEGIRMMNAPFFEGLNKKWEALGYFSPTVSEATETLRAVRSMDKGVTTKIEAGLNSKFVNFMSKPSDMAEAFTRKAAMNMGAAMAKRLYPELGDDGITVLARDFMDKSIGNFHASQRPVFFQGTLGTALGLFQTYMLTLMQNTYRHLENREFKELGKATLLQSSIFGTQSLPGFHHVSQAIGEHFSDSNVDLTTGTYRALSDPLANVVLYGLPSNLGPALYTRGDVNPRVPNVYGGINNIAAVNFIQQMGTMFGEVGRAVGQANENMGTAVLQAFSLQNMSRPLARGSEILTGNSITRAGNTIQTPEEVWTTTGILTRLLGTRPITEAKLREYDHLRTYYGAIDRENRREATNTIRTAIRAGNLTDGVLESAAEKYFRYNGSPQGWKAAVDEAIGREDTTGKEILLEKLKDTNPLIYAINAL